MTEISDIGSVRTVVQAALTKGITEVVLSPGSRNAPFILSFTALKEFRCHSMVDERSAAFVAMGIAQQQRKPVILCCTSGSAMLNYAPAIVEAYYQRIPLLVITADRPKEWIDQGEGQSIRQDGLLDGIVAKSFSLHKERSEDDAWYNQRLVNEAMECALHESRPVHINVPLSEPLYGVTPFEPDSTKGFQLLQGQRHLTDTEKEDLQRIWGESKGILILLSQMPKDEALAEQLKAISNDPRVAIVSETTANIYQLGYVCCIDRTIEAFLSTESESDFIPDLLITVGENIISKKLKALFRRHQERISHHWHLGPGVVDTFQTLTHGLDVAPSHVLAEMKSVSSQPTEFGTRWKAQFFKAEQLHQGFLDQAPYSDLTVFHSLMDLLPDGWQLQMGNSSVVRYIQLFNQLASVTYHGNRGVSGIEGCTSTAVGAALATEAPVLLVSGDHAFRYDANGLSHKPLPNNLRIIVINNGGGNIFRIINGPQEHEVSEAYIEKAEDISVESLVQFHGAAYLQASNLDEFATAMEQLVNPEMNSCTVLEVFTPRKESPEVLKRYFQHLKDGNS